MLSSTRSSFGWPDALNGQLSTASMQAAIEIGRPVSLTALYIL